MKSIFPEGIAANIDLPTDKKVECCIDNTIPQNLDPVPPDTIRFFVTTEGWRDYNKIILQNPQAYTYLLTQYPELLKLPRTVKLIGNGSFVDPAPDIKKKFGVSIVMTNRNVAPGHPLRHELYERRKEIKIPFDIYRGTWNQFEPTEDTLPMPPWPNRKEKVMVFDCMFHVCIEGFKNEYYFSEKLIDCLITKTIPIYWGCTIIDQYFNRNGMIFVDTVDDIIAACNQLSLEVYERMLPIVNDNYELGLREYKYEDILKRAMLEAMKL
ncbi:MAG: hypothetical protein ABFC18_03195 [Rikenellaceae bacterium]